MSQAAPPDLAYRAPGNRAALFFIHYAYYFIALLIPAGLACYVFLGVIPKFSEIFRDFRTTLPAVTRMVLSCAALFMHGLAWIPVFLLVVVIPLPSAWHTSALTPDAARRKRVRRLVALMALLGLMMLLLLAGPVLLPLIKLIQSVGGGDAGN